MTRLDVITVTYDVPLIKIHVGIGGRQMRRYRIDVITLLSARGRRNKNKTEKNSAPVAQQQQRINF